MFTLTELTAHLPAQPDEATLFPQIQRLVAKSEHTLVVIDDDPTGTQTVSNVELLLTWDESLLIERLQQKPRLFYLLANSRSMPEQTTSDLHTTTARQLTSASQHTGVAFTLASRSDSTLRGHYPAEIFALERGSGKQYDGHLIIPAFFEGGRYTINDTHYVATPVASSDTLLPAHETPYARDSTFGYHTAYLPAWIEEKSKGYWHAKQVISLDLRLIREGGPDAVAARLRAVTGGLPIVVNAAGYGDLAVVVLGILKAEAEGKRFIYRTAASFVRLRGGVATRPLLSPAEILGASPSFSSGLVVVGSYMPGSTRQVEALLTLPSVQGVELPVKPILQCADGGAALIAVLGRRVNELLQAGITPVVFTSRAPLTETDNIDFLTIGQRISQALIEMIRSVEVQPRFIIAKGGITSHNIAQYALGAERAHVLGQLLPGVSVWRLESGSHLHFAHVPYIVFPGNIDGPDSLKTIVQLLSAQ